MIHFLFNFKLQIQPLYFRLYFGVERKKVAQEENRAGYCRSMKYHAYALSWLFLNASRFHSARHAYSMPKTLRIKIFWLRLMTML